MSNNKLNITKFRIAKLTGGEKIIGGANPKDTTGNDLTDTSPPTDPVCIKTSKEYIKPFEGG